MADRGDAKFFQIVGRQLRQDAQIDLILAESLLVSLQPEPPQLRRNVHAALPIVEPASLVGFKLTRSAARIVPFHRSPQRPAAATTRAVADPAATGTVASGTTPAADPAPADRAGVTEVEPLRMTPAATIAGRPPPGSPSRDLGLAARVLCPARRSTALCGLLWGD
jgi:hypothetical protein